MTMVKLKMRAIYKSFLSFIGFLIVIGISLGVLYLFYDKVSEIGSDIEVNGNLSINYIDGKNFLASDKEIIKFSVTNSSDETSLYNIGFAQVRGIGSYKLLHNEMVVTEGELKSIDEITTDFISIETGETKLYTLEIANTGETPLKGILNIHVQEGKNVTFADLILKNTPASESSLTKVGYDAGIENEGLIKSSDDIGLSYYFRGNVNNNYVSFGGLTWRIVRINGDGTVRMILNGVTDTIASYYSSSNGSYNYKTSAMNEFLENWLENNLYDYTDYIANSKFCNDIIYDDIYTYNSYTRIVTNKIPTLNCLGTAFNNNIGLLTIDEVVLAGATPISYNKNYYLYDSNITEPWYTMSGAKGDASSMNLFMIDSNGNIRNDINGDLYRNVRPVINLVKNIEMEGTGTIENPYRMVK